VIPRKLTRSKEAGKRHIQGCREVDAIEVIGDFPDHPSEDWSCNWETEPLLPFAVDTFPSPDDDVDSRVMECVDLEPELEVNALKGGKVIRSGGRFGIEHDVGEPGRDCGDSGWECKVPSEIAECFVRRLDGFIVPPCSGGNRVVKKVKSFWREIDIRAS
jgi:hypothetical protein